ncbi:hypothetical protein LINPERPRIM_LOCUS5565 [Linum perenne]
MCKESTVSM